MRLNPLRNPESERPMNTTSLPIVNATSIQCESSRAPATRANLSPRQSSKRLAREWHTIDTMVGLYCRDHHEGGLCPECKGLLDYASVRLDRCRFGIEKPTCAKCPVHCYQKNRREQVRAIMRYSGPRMLWEHPILSLRHWLDGMMFVK